MMRPESHSFNWLILPVVWLLLISVVMAVTREEILVFFVDEFVFEVGNFGLEMLISLMENVKLLT